VCMALDLKWHRSCECVRVFMCSCVLCGLWVVDCGLWVVGCGLWVVGCGLWVVGCGVWVVGCELWVVGVHILHCRMEVAPSMFLGRFRSRVVVG